MASSSLHERYPPVPDSVGRARAAAVACARRLGADSRAAESIALAVSEAATNVVLHAHREGAGADEFQLTMERRSSDTLEVNVVDRGIGMAPRVDSPGLGIGLALIGQVSEAIELRAPDTGGTEVSMRFQLHGA